MCYSFPWLWLWASFLLCETWQFITAAVKEGNKEWQKTFFYSQGNGVSEDLFGKVMALLLRANRKNFIFQKKRQHS